MKALKMAHRRERSARSRVIMEKQEGEILIKILDCAFIEREKVDVIVNSVSPTLHLNGRKLSSALASSAGPGLQRALQALPGTPKVGDVLITPGFGLRSKYVYHIVTPGYYTVSAESMMENCVLQCLKTANTNGMVSIAIPALGMGGLGFPPEVVAANMLRAVARFQKSVEGPLHLREIKFALMETVVRVAFIKVLSNDSGTSKLDLLTKTSMDSEVTSPTSPLSPLIDQTLAAPLPPELDSKIKEEFFKRRKHSLHEPFIPWKWSGSMSRGPDHRESEWLDALQEDLFMIEPRSPIVLHGVAGVGKTRFLDQIQDLWIQGSLPKFRCVLKVTAFDILRVNSLWLLLKNHLVENVGLDNAQVTTLLSDHSDDLLVLVDDADILDYEILKQTISDQYLRNMNFMFSVRSPKAPWFVQCLKPSDTVELNCFTSVEVERYAAEALEDTLGDPQPIISTLTSAHNIQLCKIPGNLKIICDLLKKQPMQNFHGRQSEMMSAWMKTEFCSISEKTWFDHLQEETCQLGKVFYDFFTSGAKPLAPFWLNSVTGTDGRVFRHIMDYAVAIYIAELVKRDKLLPGCYYLETCYSLQSSLELACGMSPDVAKFIQMQILSLANRDPVVKVARAEVLDLEDEDSIITLNRLVALEGGCRREAGMEIIEGVPMELQHLGQEYVLAYERACVEGSQAVFRTRVMLVGHFGAGKTSLKRRLLNESFTEEYITTNGIEADPSACKVYIDNTYNWKLLEKGAEAGTDEYTKSVARVLHSLVQRLRPTPVASGGRYEKAVGKVLGEIADSIVANYGSWGEFIQLDPNPTKEDVITQATPETPKSTTVLSDQELKTFEDLVLAKLPGEVLRELQSLMESLDENTKPELGETEARFSFWDFAGQAVFYTTHQTFLTHRAVYIVVLDLTRPLDTPIYTYRQGRHGKMLDKTCPQTVADYLDYWLNCIHTHAMSRNYNPTSATLSPPIIIVGTHRDVVEKNYPDTASEYIDNYYTTVHKFIERKAYFEHVHLQFFSVANNTDIDPELEKLKQKIISLVQKEPYWGEKIPLKWIALRDKLRQLRENGVNVTDQATLLQKAQEVGISNTEDLCAVLKFYHELGDLVYFEEANLKDFIVLNPQWLIDAFRQVITVRHFHEQCEFPEGRRHWRSLEEHGVLHDSILDHVWEPDHKIQLITLMYKFRLLLPLPFDQLTEICTDIKDSKDQPKVSFLVPCLLPPLEQLPDLPNTLPPVLVIFREDFLPVGVTSRLITGLVTEEQWVLSGKVFHNYATFLPGGVDAGVSISICQKAELLEIQGRFLSDSKVDTEGADFRGYLMAFLRLLRCVVNSICPMAHFMLAVWCRCQQTDHGQKAVEIGSEGELLEGKERIYCRHHWKTFSTSPFAHWFKVAFPMQLGKCVEDTEYPSDRVLLQLSEEVGSEWFKLALYLDLKYQQVEQARISHPHDIVMCVYTLLLKWRKKCTLEAPQKMECLKKALVNADRLDLAETLTEIC